MTTLTNRLLARVHAEYREMPGLSLTAAQASRLLGIDRSVCERLLEKLVLDGALHCTPRGTYIAGPSRQSLTVE